jgi:YjbE family integral membrane protein
MDLLTPEFLSALAAIVVIDLVLAGDNAIVIALAARRLPAHLQRKAIAWGTVGAIAVRTLMTVIVVWLLNIPGLMLAGGAMLVWIAYKLLLPEDENGEAAVKPADSFWSALRTVVIADTVMGLDNVLAVAGAAHGSYLLVVIGLLISIPIVVWGSTLLLGFVERFPGFVYVGAGVLAWTAAKMMTSEPLLASALAIHGAIGPLVYFTIVGGVLWAGFAKNHRQFESRISARLVLLAKTCSELRTNISPTEGEDIMMKILVPVDGSRNSEFAVQQVINEYQNNRDLEVHVLNVQPPFSRYVALFAGKRDRDAWHGGQAARSLQPALHLLARHGVPYATHVEVGERARVIADTAHRLKCDHIVMSTARKNSLTRMVEDSVTNRVLELTRVPVEVVAGEAVSRWERFGIPVGLIAAVGLLVVAVD